MKTQDLIRRIDNLEKRVADLEKAGIKDPDANAEKGSKKQKTFKRRS